MTRPSEQHILRIATAGSVDDGKSTLIGRLLLETQSIPSDQLQDPSKNSEYLAQITDGLRAEREQGITIDVAYRYLTTPKRRIIIADTPGHEQYTRNMVTAASLADVALILIDASKGLTTQTKRHAFISALMGVPRIALIINKIDLVDYDQDVCDKLARQFLEFAKRLTIKDIRTFPVSALRGDNVLHTSKNTPWYKGPTLYDYLNEVYIDSDKNQIDLRFPVQGTLRLAERRLVLGQIASGSIKCGEEILVLPAHTKATIQNIIVIDQKGTEQALQTASIGKSVALELSTPVDTGRGSMIVRPGNIPTVSDHFQSMLIWMSSECIRENEPYILQQGTQRTRCKLTTIHYKLDVNTLQRHAPINLGLNDITLASIQTASVICADTYEHNRATGGFILISPTTNATVAAGVILNRQTDKFAALLDATQSGTITKSGNIHRESSHISQREREQHLSYQVSTLWFMGLSASGKSTLAKHLERNLFDAGKPVMRLDGDNLRHGLNADLGFSKQDRKENIRRIAHVAKLFNDAGIICLVCAISPYEADRAIAREVIGPHKFNLVHVSTSLEICEKRDPHGLYQRARRGEIEGFTGISAPFESPQHAAFTINTTELSIEDCLDQLIKHFDNNT